MNHQLDIIDRRLCVAPMMDWTDRHCRYFLRQVAPDARLFTEMVTAEALIQVEGTAFGGPNRLSFDPSPFGEFVNGAR